MAISPPSLEAKELPPEAVQRVIKVRRDYNTWVADETIEDYALRYTARSARKWSPLSVANTAFGAASFLVLEAIGATLLVHYGFTNAALAILATGLIIFLCGLPISVYAARYGVDMDLLTRGAGFGYIGSTITSLIYASFTFIFFALEAAIMAYALELALGIPPYLGYLICALVVIPLVTHGITRITRLQMITQPIWLILLALPFVFVLANHPNLISEMTQYAGAEGRGGQFDHYLFGAALSVGIALITQMGEQVDYLRFMPEKTPENSRRWWAGVLIGGPGWVVMGVAKMFGGCLLAYLAIQQAIPLARAVDPNQMYLAGFAEVFSNTHIAVAVTAIFVVISQLKINVTNAYAGSLAWSNFFARLTHSHPGRVVWMVFNTLIALLLMELSVFESLGQVLGLYSNIAISWIVAVVADLVINKPLGLSPKGIEFKRAHLYDINPVGVGAMLIASTLSVLAFIGLFGPTAQAFASIIALVAALVTSPLIAWLTKGRYYIARSSPVVAGNSLSSQCVICDRHYENDDMAHCPAYRGRICSLCCSLDARCHDLCKPEASLSSQWSRALRRLMPKLTWPYLDKGLGHYLLLMTAIVPSLAMLLGFLYYHEVQILGPAEQSLLPQLRLAYIKAFSALMLVAGIVAWWLVLTHKSRQVAQEESNRQTALLILEIESHRRTDEQLQAATKAADAANHAKSRYITAISHELRTPLNSILGYAQILDGDPSIPAHRRQAVNVIRRGGDHLLSLIEGTLDIARIESGKLTLETRSLDFPEVMQQIVHMFELQARSKGISFTYETSGELPAVVRADEKRMRQILINLLGNAIKFTREGGVILRLRYAREMATFEIVDSGPGIAAEEIEKVFEPFSRGSAAHNATTAGTGLGLTIAKMFTDLMGGELSIKSEIGSGTSFTVRLFLPQVHGAQSGRAFPRNKRVAYTGERRRILIVDNEQDDREMLSSVLEPLGFILDQAASGAECLEVLPRFKPDLIFMDLAMPGIDGWETIRRIRRDKSSTAHIAIISANAFDKGLENDAGITPEDFIVKPVRVSELLDWIGARLNLNWIEALPDEQHATAPHDEIGIPSRAQLETLANQVAMGYVRGIHAELDIISAGDPAHGKFADDMRQMLNNFQLDAMAQHLRRQLHAD